nr:hypothetical protein [Candidatus Bathyarchaeota archaeon]
MKFTVKLLYDAQPSFVATSQTMSTKASSRRKTVVDHLLGVADLDNIAVVHRAPGSDVHAYRPRRLLPPHSQVGIEHAPETPPNHASQDPQ